MAGILGTVSNEPRRRKAPKSMVVDDATLMKLLEADDFTVCGDEMVIELGPAVPMKTKTSPQLVELGPATSTSNQPPEKYASAASLMSWLTLHKEDAGGPRPPTSLPCQSVRFSPVIGPPSRHAPSQPSPVLQSWPLSKTGRSPSTSSPCLNSPVVPGPCSVDAASPIRRTRSCDRIGVALPVWFGVPQPPGVPQPGYRTDHGGGREFWRQTSASSAPGCYATPRHPRPVYVSTTSTSSLAGVVLPGEGFETSSSPSLPMTPSAPLQGQPPVSSAPKLWSICQPEQAPTPRTLTPTSETLAPRGASGEGSSKAAPTSPLSSSIVDDNRFIRQKSLKGDSTPSDKVASFRKSGSRSSRCFGVKESKPASPGSPRSPKKSDLRSNPPKFPTDSEVLAVVQRQGEGTTSGDDAQWKLLNRQLKALQESINQIVAKKEPVVPETPGQSTVSRPASTSSVSMLTSRGPSSTVQPSVPTTRPRLFVHSERQSTAPPFLGPSPYESCMSMGVVSPVVPYPCYGRPSSIGSSSVRSCHSSERLSYIAAPPAVSQHPPFSSVTRMQDPRPQGAWVQSPQVLGRQGSGSNMPQVRPPSSSPTGGAVSPSSHLWLSPAPSPQVPMGYREYSYPVTMFSPRTPAPTTWSPERPQPCGPGLRKF